MTTREHDETRSMREGEDRQRQALDETKHATKTTEFFTFVGLIIALIIAGGAIDDLDAGRVWLYVTILGVGYMVSRGLAKSGAGAMAETNHSGGAPIGERVKAAAEALSGGEGGSPRAGEGQEHGPEAGGTRADRRAVLGWDVGI